MKYAVLCIAIAVAGCQATNQRQIDELRARCNFSEDARFTALRGKIPLSPLEGDRPPTVADLSNNARPSPVERRAILALDEASAPCRDDTVVLATRMGGPAAASVFRELASANVSTAAALANGGLSYGEYRQVVWDNRVKAEKALAQYLQAQQVADAASRQAAAVQMAATAQTFRSFQQPQLPNILSTQCSSYRLGRTVQTDCR